MPSLARMRLAVTSSSRMKSSLLIAAPLPCRGAILWAAMGFVNRRSAGRLCTDRHAMGRQCVAGRRRRSALCQADTAPEFRNQNHVEICSDCRIQASCLRPPPRARRTANFPDHPIRVIVSVPAGGGVDTVTRIVAAKMSAVLGQPLSVENKSGAGGSVAAEAVFHADARRLHLAGLAAGADHHQSVPLQVAQLRSDAADAGRDHVACAERASGAAGFPGQNRAGADRLRQGQSGQAQLCARRASAPPRT